MREIDEKEEIQRRGIELLKQMQEQVIYHVEPPAKKSYLSVLLKKIPWMARFLPSALGKASVLANVGEQVSGLDHSPAGLEWSRGFHFGSMALSAFDFFRIPLIYLDAYLLGEKIPITLNNNARWLYSGVLLGLTITAFAVPPVALIIAFVATSIVLMESVYVLYKLEQEVDRLNKAYKAYTPLIERAEAEMKAIQLHASELEERLKIAVNPEEITDLNDEIQSLFLKYEAKKLAIERLKGEQLVLKQELKATAFDRTLDRFMGLVFTVLSLVGLVLSLFMPPAGIALLMIAGLGGASYALGRLLTPVFSSMVNWIKSKMALKSTEEESAETPTLTVASQIEPEKHSSMHKMHDMMGEFHLPSQLPTVEEEDELEEEQRSTLTARRVVHGTLNLDDEEEELLEEDSFQQENDDNDLEQESPPLTVRKVVHGELNMDDEEDDDHIAPHR